MASHRLRRSALFSLLVLALVTRALVPVGFMPADDGSARLTLCPNGMLMPADDGANTGAPSPGHLHTEHCPFGSAPFAAPLAHVPVHRVLAAAIGHTEVFSSSRIFGARTTQAHQPRAPPA